MTRDRLMAQYPVRVNLGGTIYTFVVHGPSLGFGLTWVEPGDIVAIPPPPWNPYGPPQEVEVIGLGRPAEYSGPLTDARLVRRKDGTTP